MYWEYGGGTMSEINIRPKKIKTLVGDLETQKREMVKQKHSVERARAALRGTINNQQLANALNTVEDELAIEIKVMDTLGNKLKEITSLYINTESRITGYNIGCAQLLNIVNGEIVINDDIFNERWDDLLDVLQQFPMNLSDLKDGLWGLWDTDFGNFMEKEVFESLSGVISKFLAFEYNENEDHYFTDENYGIQRWAGFMDLFDDLGPALGMDLDTEILTFTPEGSDKEYRLQFWKGEYGFGGAYGGEIGLYSREATDNPLLAYSENNPLSKLIRYDCVSGEDEIETTQVIYNKDGEVLMSNSTADYAENGDHFWNLSIKTDPGYDSDDLVVVEYLNIDDPAMHDAIIESLEGHDQLTYLPDQSTDDVIAIQYGEFN